MLNKSKRINFKKKSREATTERIGDDDFLHSRFDGLNLLDFVNVS